MRLKKNEDFFVKKIFRKSFFFKNLNARATLMGHLLHYRRGGAMRLKKNEDFFVKKFSFFVILDFDSA